MRISSIQENGNLLQSKMYPATTGTLDSIMSNQSDMTSSGAGANVEFGDVLSQAINSVNDLQIDADKQAQLLATGQLENPHDAAIAIEKADLAIQLTVKVTDKILSAYRQVSQMQL